MIKKLTALSLTAIIAISTAIPTFAMLPYSTPPTDTPIDGGTMIIGVLGHHGSGVFNPLFSSGGYDAFIQELILPPLLVVGTNMLISNYGPASFEFDAEDLTLTITLTEDLFWHDGYHLTLDDLLFAYEVIGHPDYIGHRFNQNFERIIGMWEYREGEADYISGIKLSDDKMTMVISYEYFSPSMLFGDSIWSTPISRRSFENVPVSEMEWAAQSRHEIVGYGAFILDDIVSANANELSRNYNFWLGTPYIAHLLVLAGDNTLLENSIIDVLIGNATSIMQDIPYHDNFSYIAHPNTSLGFTAFQMSKFNPITGEREFDAQRTISDINLRRAMGYSINEQRIIDTLGRQSAETPAISAVMPFSGMVYEEMLGFSVFDTDLANKILDEAGYTKRDSEGFRMTPEGLPMTLTWAVHFNFVNEIIVPMVIEDWANVGIRVELWQNDLVEFFTLTDLLFHNQQWWDFEIDDIDLYDMAFFLGFNPTTVWGQYSEFNATGYASEEHTAMLDRLASLSAIDLDYAQAVFRDWQIYFYENAIAIPRRYTSMVTAVSNRVANFSRRPGNIREVSAMAVHLWQLSSEPRVTPQNNPTITAQPDFSATNLLFNAADQVFVDIMNMKANNSTELELFLPPVHERDFYVMAFDADLALTHYDVYDLVSSILASTVMLHLAAGQIEPYVPTTIDAGETTWAVFFEDLSPGGWSFVVYFRLSR